MKKIDAAARDRILDAMEQVSTLVDSGLDPDAAIVRVVKQAGVFPPGHVQLMIQAYNTGQANQQRRDGDTTLDRAASVPLASPETVMAALYPGNLKSAAQTYRATRTATDYVYSPRDLWAADWQKEELRREQDGLPAFAQEKQASASTTVAADRSRTHRSLLTAPADFERLLGEHRVQIEAAHHKLARSLQEAQHLVHRGLCEPFEEIKANLLAAYGKPAEVLMRQLAGDRPATSAKTASYQPYDVRREPYRTLHQCIASLHALAAAETKYAALASHPTYRRAREHFSRAAAVEKTAAAEDGTKGKEPKPPPPPEGFAGNFSLGLTQALAPMAPGPEKNWRKIDDQLLEELEAPEHKFQLQKIRAQASLADLISNDEVISGYDPEEVTTFYNDIQRLAPRAVQQPAILRAVLRRALAQGALDTHELDQLAKIDETLAKSKSLNSRQMLIPETAMVPIGARRYAAGGKP